MLAVPFLLGGLALAGTGSGATTAVLGSGNVGSALRVGGAELGHHSFFNCLFRPLPAN